MLQWMGGSRRKVAASRKSTERRQRQYFEQRKRQKQTSGLGNYANEIIPCRQEVQLHDKPRSLDILSLLNLKTVTEESNSGCTTAKENPSINDSPVYLKCKMPSNPDKVFPRQSVDLKEAKNFPSNRQVDTESPKKIISSVPDSLPSPHNHSSDRNGDKLDYWRKATENQLSILDVLGDDGPNNNVEESPVCEAHVAFSVQGLGKVGIETPCCSPRPSSRMFFDERFSPPKDVKRFHSSKDFKFGMDDKALELSAIIHDINLPFGGNSSKKPSKSRNTMHHFGNLEDTEFTFPGCMQPNVYGNQLDDFPGEEEYLYSNRGNFVNEKKYGVCWGNQLDQTDCDFNCLLGNKRQTHQSSFAFEDSSLHGIRDADRAVSDFNILGSPSLHFEDPASDRENFIVTKDKSRYSSLDGSWEFSTGTDQPAWSFMTEDIVDNMSLLSEESCSSSAVRGDKCYNSASTSVKRMPRQGNEVCRSSENNFAVENLYTEETQNRNKDEIHRGNNVKVPGKYPTVPKKMRSKLEDYTKDLHCRQEDLGGPQSRWAFLGEYSSADKDLGLGSFCKISAETEPMSLDLEFFSEDHSNILSSSKRFKFDVASKCAYSANEKAAVQQPPSPKNSYDSPLFSNTESSLKKPDVSPAARMEVKPPDSSDAVDFQECTDAPCVSRRESVSNCQDEKLEFHHTYCGKLVEGIQQGVSIGNFELTSLENKKESYDADSNDNCGEYTVVNDDTLEPLLKSRTSYDDAEKSSTIKDKPGKLENTIDVKKWTKENDASLPKRRNAEGIGWNANVNSTYQIMLQSCVQLFCVQKVLKGVNEQGSLKKA